MKTKKIFSLLMAFMTLLSFEVLALEDIQYDNIFDNPILELVAPVKPEPGVPSEGAVQISHEITWNENSSDNTFAFESFTRYSDGSYKSEYLFTFGSYDVEKASSRYPAFIKGDPSGKYVGYLQSEDKVDTEFNTDSGRAFYNDIYLIDTTGPEVTQTLIGSLLQTYNIYSYTYTYIPCSAVLENNVIVRTPTTETPLSEQEFKSLKKGTQYNDGLKFGKPADVEYGALYGFSDINGRIYFEDPQTSYFNYFYNLGYLVTISNNGYALDYSVDDYEKDRIFWSSIENVFTGENCGFEDVNIMDIYDSGYALVSVKDAERNETTYIARIKKPAVIKVMVNGEKILFDVLPTITEGRTLVPLRAIFEALGASVTWDGAAQTVTAVRDGLQVVLTIGSNQILVGSEAKTLDVPAQITAGRTLVPARAVAEAFGCNVDWDAENNAVIIKY